MAARIRSGLILLALGLVMLQVAQPYMQGYQFEKLVRQELEQPRSRDQAGSLHKRILDQGRSMGLSIAPEDILVERLVRGYEVRVNYAAPLDFRVYRTEVKFNMVARTTSSQVE